MYRPKPSRKSSGAQSRFGKLLCRVLNDDEVEILVRVIAAERKGKHVRAGRLGIAQSLIARGWLASRSWRRVAPDRRHPCAAPRK